MLLKTIISELEEYEFKEKDFEEIQKILDNMKRYLEFPIFETYDKIVNLKNKFLIKKMIPSDIHKIIDELPMKDLCEAKLRIEKAIDIIEELE